MNYITKLLALNNTEIMQYAIAVTLIVLTTVTAIVPATANRGNI
tara:strand:+ start:169 stop:300 length:132 start_codon:yes stop_codon:yes gene_type:complete